MVSGMSICSYCNGSFSSRGEYETHANQAHPRTICCDRSCGKKGKKLFRAQPDKARHESHTHREKVDSQL